MFILQNEFYGNSIFCAVKNLIPFVYRYLSCVNPSWTRDLTTINLLIPQLFSACKCIYFHLATLAILACISVCLSFTYAITTVCPNNVKELDRLCSGGKIGWWAIYIEGQVEERHFPSSGVSSQNSTWVVKLTLALYCSLERYSFT